MTDTTEVLDVLQALWEEIAEKMLALDERADRLAAGGDWMYAAHVRAEVKGLWAARVMVNEQMVRLTEPDADVSADADDDDDYTPF